MIMRFERFSDYICFARGLEVSHVGRILTIFSIFLTDIPQSILSLGSNLNGSNIKEGDDVYFECSVRANPKPYKISWRFNVSAKIEMLLKNFKNRV